MKEIHGNNVSTETGMGNGNVVPYARTYGTNKVKEVNGSVDFSDEAIENLDLLFPATVCGFNGLVDNDFFNEGI